MHVDYYNIWLPGSAKVDYNFYPYFQVMHRVKQSKIVNLVLSLTSCFGLMADSAVVDSALVDAALCKSGLI
jgi:hypothetical protein